MIKRKYYKFPERQNTLLNKEKSQIDIFLSTIFEAERHWKTEDRERDHQQTILCLIKLTLILQVRRKNCGYS